MSLTTHSSFNVKTHHTNLSEILFHAAIDTKLKKNWRIWCEIPASWKHHATKDWMKMMTVGNTEIFKVAVPSEKTKTVKKQCGRGENRTARALWIIRMIFLVIKQILEDYTRPSLWLTSICFQRLIIMNCHSS